MNHICPQCGKTMTENPTWPGLWECPDSKIRLNDSAPFRWKCRGREFTQQAVDAFDAECRRIIAERN